MSSHLEHVLATHLEPNWGSPYWLQRQRELGYPLPERIKTIADLACLGPFDLDTLRTRPVTDFLPRQFHAKTNLILGETGGATGVPASTAYTDGDFHSAFVQPFLDCVDCESIFNDGFWLWIGPGGPHVIGKAAQRISRLTTGCDAFSVDFDPRWYRRLAAGSIARKRYLQHVLEQSARVIHQQPIAYLFATPVVLLDLRGQMSDEERTAIRFLYLGGMAIDPDVMSELAAAFPNATFLSGYGNTLFGVIHQASPGRPNGNLIHYYPRGERLVVGIVPEAEAPHGEPGAHRNEDSKRLSQTVDYDTRGQVVMSRLDLCCFLPNVMERDSAVRLTPPASGQADGIGDPRPRDVQSLVIDNGIY